LSVLSIPKKFLYATEKSKAFFCVFDDDNHHCNEFITRTKSTKKKGQVLTTNRVLPRQKQNDNLMSEHIAACDIDTQILSLSLFISLMMLIAWKNNCFFSRNDNSVNGTPEHQLPSPTHFYIIDILKTSITCQKLYDFFDALEKLAVIKSRKISKRQHLLT
jgi:hypothetical protein